MMELIHNRKGESFDRMRLSRMLKEKIAITSAEGERFQVSKFMIGFMSDSFQDVYDYDYDMILTSIESSQLEIMVSVLNMREGSEVPDDFTATAELGIEMECFNSLVRALHVSQMNLKQESKDSASEIKESACDVINHSINEQTTNDNELPLPSVIMQCPKKETPTLEEESDKNSTSFLCDQRPYTTNNKGSMRLHSNNIHKRNSNLILRSKQREKIICPECGRFFKFRSELRKHEKQVHFPEPCHECGKVVSNMGEHLRRHKTVRDFNCSSCPKGFISNQKLKEHERAIHEGILFKCRYPDCSDNGGNGGVGYRDSSNREAHERRKHGASYNRRIRIDLE